MSISAKSLQKSILSQSYLIKLKKETQGFLSRLNELKLAPLPAARLFQSVDINTRESFPVSKWACSGVVFCFKGNKWK